MAKKTDGGDALQLGLVQLQQAMVACIVKSSRHWKTGTWQ